MTGVVRPKIRQWIGSKSTTAESGWPVAPRPVDNDLRFGLAPLRARSRDLVQNSDHGRQFKRLVGVNVVGPQGIQLQARPRLRNGRINQRLAGAIEAGWAAWGKRGVCDVTGQLSWAALSRLVIEQCAPDGEFLIRVLRGWGNDHGFALQVIDPATLDDSYDTELKGGGEIRMGVELDVWRRPVAYYLTDEPGITAGGYRGAPNRTRVPADQIIHGYVPEWANQTRGVPWLATPVLRARMLQGYQEAEVTAARAGASKMGFYVKQQWAAEAEAPGAEEVSGSASGIGLAQTIEPGVLEELPYGWDFKSHSTDHPNTAFPDFTSSVLQSMSSALGVSYYALSGDVGSANYSSLRQAALLERDIWMGLQAWAIEWLCEPVYRAWLDTQVAMGEVAGVPLSAARISDYQRVEWQPRRWSWVDPQKEQAANEQALAQRTKSVSEIIRDRGRDPDDVWQEIARDQERMRELGIDPAGGDE